MNEETLSNLDSDEIEEIEKLTLRWIFQAVLDFGYDEITKKCKGEWQS